jgi:hypothetical protein
MQSGARDIRHDLECIGVLTVTGLPILAAAHHRVSEDALGSVQGA